MRKKMNQPFDTPLEETYGRQKKEDFQREIRWDKLDNTAHLFPVIA